MQFPLLSEWKRFVVPDVAVAEVGGGGSQSGGTWIQHPCGRKSQDMGPRVRASSRKRRPFSPKEP